MNTIEKTWEEERERFIMWHSGSINTARTYRSRLSKTETYFTKKYGLLPDPTTITASEVGEFLGYLSNENANNYVYCVFSTFVNFLRFAGNANVGEIKKLMPKRERHYPSVRPYTLEEVRIILNMFDKYSFKSHQMQTLVWTIFWTGMRLREVLNLKEMDVNIEKRSIFVHGMRNRRTVYIPDALTPVLDEYISDWKNIMKTIEDHGENPSAYIFSFKDKDKKLRVAHDIAVRYAYEIKKNARRCGIDGFTITKLRWTLVVLLHKAGASSRDLKYQIYGPSLRDFLKEQWSIELYNPHLSLNDSYSKLEEWLLKPVE